MRILLLICAAAALLASPTRIAAQDRIGCALPADTNSMRVTLPPAVLDHLQGISSSVFVHAYLIRLISPNEAGEHRLSECARRFKNADLQDVRTMREHLPDASEIINALRAAGEEQRIIAQLVDSSRVGDPIARLLADRSAGTVNESATKLRAAAAVCRGNQRGACGILSRAVDGIAALQQARNAVAAAEGRARQAEAAVQQIERELVAPVREHANDSISLAQLKAMDPPPVPESLTELEARIARWRVSIDSLAVARDSAQSHATRERQAQEAETATAQRAEEDLGTLLGRLAQELEERGLDAGNVLALTGAPIQSFMKEVAAPPVKTAPGNPSTRSPNLLLDVTDFIVERARREAVNSFIINLHRLAVRAPLLQSGFRDTWGLMNSISTRSDSLLNAVEVGRIPLGVWRATLAGDFVMLPVSLMEAGPGIICHDDANAERPAAQPAADTVRSACKERAAVLRPLVTPARRLLTGEGVFDVLRDASSFASQAGPHLPEGWNRVSQALTMVAELAATYVMQGYAPTADPTKHPYILTARSLTDVPKDQRDALMRLLLVRAIPRAETRLAWADERGFLNALGGTTRLFERIASRQSSSDSASADAGRLLHTSFEALGGAFDYAYALLPAATAVRLDSIRGRWMAASGALEPLVTGNFGLALSRTIVLLRSVRDREVPGSLITFAGLASALSEAQTSEQVRVAFDAAASPVGGWQSKRYGEGGASITAFPGMAGGFEYVLRNDDDPEEVSRHATALGASLPIGIELQPRLRQDSPALASGCVICGAGLFLPLIDLGALLSYRISGPDSVEAEPNANLRQVFAPGAFLSLSITRSVPITVLVGAQLMPSLRSVESAEGTVRRSVVRYGISIGMDILLFDF